MSKLMNQMMLWLNTIVKFVYSKFTLKMLQISGVDFKGVRFNRAFA